MHQPTGSQVCGRVLLNNEAKSSEPRGAADGAHTIFHRCGSRPGYLRNVWHSAVSIAVRHVGIVGYRVRRGYTLL